VQPANSNQRGFADEHHVVLPINTIVFLLISALMLLTKAHCSAASHITWIKNLLNMAN
jgi:hypothetical protein